MKFFLQRQILVSGLLVKILENYWLNALKKKKKYSLGGLVWFTVGPVAGIFGYDKDSEPHKAFCSEATTNAISYTGEKIFDFLCNRFEELIYIARRSENFSIFKNYITKIDEAVIKENGFTLENFYKTAKNDNKWYWGYKISPRVFKINSKLKSNGYLEIYNDKVIYNR